MTKKYHLQKKFRARFWVFLCPLYKQQTKQQNQIFAQTKVSKQNIYWMKEETLLITEYGKATSDGLIKTTCN